MTRIGLFAAAGAALFVITSVQAVAQAPGNPGQGRGQGRRGGAGSPAAMPIAQLEKMLSLNEEQKTKITAIQEKARAEMQALGNVRDAGNREKVQAITKKATDDITAVLNADQKKKFEALVKVGAAVRGTGIPPVAAAELNLTAEQLKKLADIAKETRDKTQALSQEERRTKGREIQDEARKKAMDVLTAEQKTKLEKYMQANPQGRQRRPNPNP
jgi:Spy/CpxP family protein refolding chaperone